MTGSIVFPSSDFQRVSAEEPERSPLSGESSEPSESAASDRPAASRSPSPISGISDETGLIHIGYNQEQIQRIQQIASQAIATPSPTGYPLALTIDGLRCAISRHNTCILLPRDQDIESEGAHKRLIPAYMPRLRRVVAAMWWFKINPSASTLVAMQETSEFHKENRIFSMLQKKRIPNIPEYYGFISAPRINITLNEFFEMDLFSWLNLRCAEDSSQIVAHSCQSILKIAQDLALALSSLHQENLVHRDIKPENILVTRHPTLRAALTDFDAVRTVESHDVVPSAGTPGYFPPEVFERYIRCQRENVPINLNDLDLKKIDMWSFGIVLTSLLTAGLASSRIASIVNQLRKENSAHIADILIDVVEQLDTCIGALHQRRQGLSDPEKLPDTIFPLIRGLLHRDPEQRHDAQTAHAILSAAFTSVTAEEAEA